MMRFLSTPKGRLVRWACRAVLATLLLASWAARARAANAMRLIVQSDFISELRIEKISDKGLLTTRVIRVLKRVAGDKGKLAAPRVDLSEFVEGKLAGRLKQLRASIKRFGNTAVFFTGKGEKGKLGALLHVAGNWISMGREKKAAADKPWEALNVCDPTVLTAWDGGSEMLAKVVKLIVKHPYTSLVGTVDGWSDLYRVGKAPGAVSGLMVVDLDGTGTFRLHAACAQGDRLFLFDAPGRRFVDETRRAGLSLGSRRATWADVDGDGRLDLVSWDGKALRFQLRKKKGSFAPASELRGAPREPCLGLQAMDAGTGRQAGLLWSGPGGPVVINRGKGGKGGKVDLNRLVLGPAGKDLGKLAPCLLADLNGDGLADILQPGSRRGLIFAGKGSGCFDSPRVCAVTLGKGPSGAFFGDWDMDGRLDLFSVNPAGVHALWRNRPGVAKAKSGVPVFTDVLGLSGAVRYLIPSDASGGGSCDFNNDGRPDIFFTCAKSRKLPFFFNFGCRSMKSAERFDEQSVKTLGPARLPGLRAQVVDLDGNGLQDLVAADARGRLYACFRFVEEEDEGPRLALRVVLPPGGPTTGPVRVTAWNDRSCMGAQNVTAGGPGAFFALEEPGDIKVAWRLPGGKSKVMTKLTLEDKPLRLVISAPARPAPKATLRPGSPGKQ
jgi:FG-GAP-like repeat